MQTPRIAEVEDFAGFHENDDQPEGAVIALPTPALRLADASDVAVLGPARALQNDLAQAFAAAPGWTVKRTVIVGLVFHAVILGSLGLAASNLIPHLVR